MLDVHLMGSVNCTKAVWDIMREQNYGRVVVTTSSSGLYGNFGQTNYGAAKMGVIGMMNTLAQEGAKNDVKINALAPTAGTRMTEGLIPDKAFDLMTPETVTPLFYTLFRKMHRPARFWLRALVVTRLQKLSRPTGSISMMRIKHLRLSRPTGTLLPIASQSSCRLALSRL